MNRFVHSFASEIVKLASSEAAERASPKSRDYAASALAGAVATPAVALAANLVSRAVRNRMLAHHLGSSRLGRLLFSHLRERGPLVGRKSSGRNRPAITYDDLAGRAAAGALTGSGVQMVRDRFANSANVRSDRA